MIYVTGDTHGQWMHRLSMASFPEQRDMTREDYVIILGDFGIWDGSRREKHDLDWLDSRAFTTLFVAGNHSNYDILDSLPVEEWHGGKVNFVRPSVIHLMRGQVYEIDQLKFFAFGGASSHDISAGILEPEDPHFKEKKKRLDQDPFALYRIHHVSWWERELPSQMEMSEGVENLRKNGNKVDYILTHSPCTSIMMQMGGSGLYKRDVLTDYFQKIKENVEFRHWLFGHMHVNQTFSWERSSCLYEQILRIA